jgi:peptide/nickel transport system permease protein
MNQQGYFLLKSLWRKHLSFRLSSLFLLLYLFCALFADVLPLSFSPNELDPQNIQQPPLTWTDQNSKRHLLGTDAIGRDVLANLIYGCRTSFLISFAVMAFATGLGTALGSVAGFLGDRSIRISYAACMLFLIAIGFAWFYGVYIRQYALTDAASSSPADFAFEAGISLAILTGIGVLAKGVQLILVHKLKLRQTFYLPIDMMVIKLIELITAVPRLILILCLAAFIYPSLSILLLLIILTYWPGSARLMRAEMFKVKALPYIQAAKSLGIPSYTIFLRHALPNAIAPVMVAFTFGVSGLLVLESSLSFLGIGVPTDLPSWGRIIAGIRSNLYAWWLVLLPGITLSLTAISWQTCSYYLQKAFLNGAK